MHTLAPNKTSPVGDVVAVGEDDGNFVVDTEGILGLELVIPVIDWSRFDAVVVVEGGAVFWKVTNAPIVNNCAIINWLSQDCLNSHLQ